MKMMRPDLFTDPVARKRFEREARSIARLSHPNLATLLRVGEAEERLPYLVMEYVKGVSLADALEAGGPFPPEVGRVVLTQIASALAAAHGADVIHRNVKPANVIWDADSYRAVLTDFGFARIMDDADEGHTRMTQLDPVTDGMVVVSPEQLMGEPITPAADIYGLGVLGYRVLADTNPHSAHTMSELARAQLMDPPTPLRELAPEVEEGIAVVIERCLARDPAERPTAQQVVMDLTNVLRTPARAASDDHTGESTPLPAAAAQPAKAGEPRGIRGFLRRLLGE